jgi:hypothetical protein
MDLRAADDEVLLRQRRLQKSLKRPFYPSGPKPTILEQNTCDEFRENPRSSVVLRSADEFNFK